MQTASTHTHTSNHTVYLLYSTIISLSLYIYICTHIYVYVFMCMYLYTYICVYICIKTATCRWEYRVARRSSLTSCKGHGPVLSQNLRSNSLSIEEVYVGLMRQNGALTKKTAVTWVHQNKGLAKGSLLRVKLHKLKPQLCWKWSSKQVARTHCQVWDRWPDFEVGW